MTKGRAFRAGCYAIALVGLLAGGVASAQEIERGTSIEDLPRPGYEPRTIRLGTVVIAPEINVLGRYDNNIFATSTSKDDDYLVDINPEIDIVADSANLKVRSNLSANVRGFADHGTQNSTEFGGGTDATWSLNQKNQLTGSFRYDRAVENRTDPEANPNQALSPRKIDVWRAEGGYRYRGNRIGLGVNGAARRINYLSVTDADKDLISYRGSVRASYMFSARLDGFVEGYINRRDARLSFDRNGVDRDSTTKGVNVGASVDIASRWKGEVGFGVFRANPDGRDPLTLAPLRSFSGFGANGNISFSPDERTAFTAAFFRGDVATVQSGASGRIDTRFSLRWDQEVRHNLLFGAIAGYRVTDYRGNVNRTLKTASIGAEAEYLLSGQISLLLNANYADRNADVPTDEYEKFVVGIGTRLRY